MVIQMMGTDYARILRAIYAFAQVIFSCLPVIRLIISNLSARDMSMIGIKGCS